MHLELTSTSGEPYATASTVREVRLHGKEDRDDDGNPSRPVLTLANHESDALTWFLTYRLMYRGMADTVTSTLHGPLDGTVNIRYEP